MQVVGYMREVAGVGAETLFAQSERIRRWVTDREARLVAVFQDAKGAETLAGYQALLDAIDSRPVDAVVLPSLDVLSPDLIVQEVRLWDLRRRGVGIISTDPDEIPLLAEPSAQAARRLVRDVLARVAEQADAFGLAAATRPTAEPETETPIATLVEHASTARARGAAPVDGADVIVELVRAELAADAG